MERIGIAASKMAKGNFLLYNIFVVLLSFLFSMMIFVLAGSSVVFALMIIEYVITGVMPLEFGKHEASAFRLCMVTLTIVVSLFNVFAILKNLRIRRPHK